MSDPVSPTTSGEAQISPPQVSEWMQVFAQSLSQVLAQIAGSPFPVEVLTEAPADALPPGESDLPVVITTAGALRGEMSLRLARDSTFVLAQLLLSESREAVPDFKPEHRDAAEELLRQVAGQTASALKPRWGEVHLRLEFGSPPSWPAGVSGWIGSASGAPAAFWLEWQLSAALVVALTTPPSPPASPSAELPAAPLQDSPAGQLGMLMDVGLDVTLRFGGKRLLLREILELGPGSVVELDRQVQEPADLLLDGKLIARGEVVVVEGSYGLRVLEVISPPSSG